MATRNLPTADAGPQVRDAMLRVPDTLSPRVTVGEIRALLENPRMRMVLLVEAGVFRGAVPRERLEGTRDDAMTLGELADPRAPTVEPDAPLQRAVTLLDEHATERLPVVEPDGTLVGLVCFNRDKGHFCVDAD